MLIGIFSGCADRCNINIAATTANNEFVADNPEKEGRSAIETTPVEIESVPAYFEFFPDIEELTEEEMYEIRDAWGQ